jgi:hypothetical protein
MFLTDQDEDFTLDPRLLTVIRIIGWELFRIPVSLTVVT